MIGTYSTIDFGELYDELQKEIYRLRSEYSVYDKPHAERVNDYNDLTTALLIMREVKSR